MRGPGAALGKVAGSRSDQPIVNSQPQYSPGPDSGGQCKQVVRIRGSSLAANVSNSIMPTSLHGKSARPFRRRVSCTLQTFMKKRRCLRSLDHCICLRVDDSIEAKTRRSFERLKTTCFRNVKRSHNPLRLGRSEALPGSTIQLNGCFHTKTLFRSKEPAVIVCKLVLRQHFEHSQQVIKTR